MTTVDPPGSIESSADAHLEVPWRRRPVRNGPATIAAVIFTAGFSLAYCSSDRALDSSIREAEIREHADCLSQNDRANFGRTSRQNEINADQANVDALVESVDNPVDPSEFAGYNESPDFFKAFIQGVIADGVTQDRAQLELDRQTLADDKAEYEMYVAAIPFEDCNDNNVAGDPGDFTGR